MDTEKEPRESFRIALLITAAGKSTRMGTAGKKEYLPLEGYPSVLAKTFSAFISAADYAAIIITIPEKGERAARKALGTPPGDNFPLFVEGGDTRQESVRKGLEALEHYSPEIVLIHDAARPWVSGKIITAVITATAEYGAAAPVIPSTDAVKKVDPQGYIISHLPRPETFYVQTPQGFRFPEILSAHRRAVSDGKSCIDDTEIYHSYAGSVITVPGEPENRKITFNCDVT